MAVELLKFLKIDILLHYGIHLTRIFMLKIKFILVIIIVVLIVIYQLPKDFFRIMQFISVINMIYLLLHFPHFDLHYLIIEFVLINREDVILKSELVGIILKLGMFIQE